MPPWKPQPEWGQFAHSRRLTDLEISFISRWARAGAPRGNRSSEPPAPQFESSWQLGDPSVVLRLPEKWTAPAGGPDLYRCLVIPIAAGKDHYVRAFEFRPGDNQALHHALFFVDASISGPPSSSYDCFGSPGFLPSAALGGWTPGSRAVAMPEGTAIRVPARARLVVQLHVHPTGKLETIDPQLALYFADGPPRRTLMDVALGSHGIEIAPGDATYTVRDYFELPVPVEVTGIIPHAHYICQDMKAWAVLPDGSRRNLLWIKDWDFNWQEQYRYRTPFTLPAGARIQMLFTYNNSDQNVRNPHHPPERVTWGPGSENEMAGLHLQVIPRNAEDAHELGLALWGKIMRDAGGSFYRRPQSVSPK
jgi:hypothetical protein